MKTGARAERDCFVFSYLVYTVVYATVLCTWLCILFLVELPTFLHNVSSYCCTHCCWWCCYYLLLCKLLLVVLLEWWCWDLEGVGLGEGVGHRSSSVGYGDLGQELVMSALGPAHYFNLHISSASAVILLQGVPPVQSTHPDGRRGQGWWKPLHGSTHQKTRSPSGKLSNKRRGLGFQSPDSSTIWGLRMEILQSNVADSVRFWSGSESDLQDQTGSIQKPVIMFQF